jgi:hypothetical protein
MTAPRRLALHCIAIVGTSDQKGDGHRAAQELTVRCGARLTGGLWLA